MKTYYDKNGKPEFVLLSYAEFKSIKEMTIQPLRRWYVNNKNSDAIGYYVDSKLFCLLKGSRTEFDPKNSMNESNKRLREELKDQGILKEALSYHYVFSEDYTCKSPSQAASLVYCGSKSGNECFGKFNDEEDCLTLEKMKPLLVEILALFEDSKKLSLAEITMLIKSFEKKEKEKRIWYLDDLPEDLLFEVLRHFYSLEFDFSDYPNIKRI